MDTSENTHISLCSGYGGIDLGLKRVLPNLRTVAYAEIEAFAIENLLTRMEGGQLDAAPIWSDLKSFPWAEFSGRVDILSGGYPCQPFSAAGKRLGADDPRHLWPHIASGIRLLRPRICFFENVEGHISLGLREVIADLESLGYQTAWGIFSAAEVGAPHQRKRVFIMAYRSGEGLQGRKWIREAGAQRVSSGHFAECGGAMAVASSIGGAAGFSGSLTGDEGKSGIANNCRAQDIWPSRPGEPQHAWEPPRVVGNAEMPRRSQSGTDQLQAGINTPLGDAGREAGTARKLGNASLLDGSGQTGGQRETQAGRADTTRDDGQAESSLGGNSDGAASGMGYAELCVTCDNRTDELRLLGNGVVPATAALAFRTLLKELAQ